MDISYRRTFERSSSTVSNLPNLLSLVPKVDPTKYFNKILTELAEDLYEKGGIDIRETFIDCSFTPEKKVRLSVIPIVAASPRSWQLHMRLVFMLPVTYKALPPRNKVGLSHNQESLH